MTKAKVGDIVVITAEHPAGAVETNELGEIGVVINYDKDENVYEIAVQPGARWGGFWYEESEFRPATDEECRVKLASMFIKE